MASEVRIDKWLWAVRFYKTRNVAIEACRKGRIKVNGLPAKPSRLIKAGDVISIYRPPVTWSYRVIQAVDNRVGPKKVAEMVEDITPLDQRELAEMNQAARALNRAKGLGRPTKKERRDLDEFNQSSYEDE